MNDDEKEITWTSAQQENLEHQYIRLFRISKTMPFCWVMYPGPKEEE